MDGRKEERKEGRKEGREHIEDFVDEVREVFVVGAHVSGSVGRKLGARGVQRIGELVEKGHEARGRQLAC
jgi:hypothetical protein